MKKLKFENKQDWTERSFYASRRECFRYSLLDKYHAVTAGWLYVFFWDNTIQEEFQE